MWLNRMRRLRFTRSFSTNSSCFYDIVVVGGGLVGNTMACSLASSPKLRAQRILLIESGHPKSLPSSPPESYGVRVSAVSPASVELFKRLGVWNQINGYRTQPVSDLYVLDGCSQSCIHFPQLDARNPIAHIVENDAIISALYDRLVQLYSKEKENFAHLTVEAECRVESCSLPDNLSKNAKVTLANGKIIETSLLIGADGSASRVREAMGVNYTNWDYEQSAIVSTLDISSLEKPSIAWQRFTPLGPVALLPLADGVASLVWTTSRENAKRLLSISENEFIDELNNYLHSDAQQSSIANKTLFALDKFLNLLPTLSSTSGYFNTNLHVPTVVSIQHGSQRASFPLGFGHTGDYVTTRAALIGDAAHRVHPLAGQGVNLGWFDVQSLTKCLENAISEGADIGSTTYLADYDTQSQRHNVPVMLAIDWLNRLYSNEFGPLVLLRSLGLHTLNKLLPVKDFIIHKASG